MKMSWCASLLCPGLPLFDYGRGREACLWMAGALAGYGLLGPVGLIVHAWACLRCRRVEMDDAELQSQ